MQEVVVVVDRFKANRVLGKAVVPLVAELYLAGRLFMVLVAADLSSHNLLFILQPICWQDLLLYALDLVPLLKKLVAKLSIIHLFALNF